jgi:CheY-like chemotaxis protein
VPENPSTVFPSSPLRVLVVDDYRDAVEALCTLLRAMGHEARGVTRGAQVLDAVEAFEPAVVLLDIGMPDLSGYEVARALRARSRPCPHLVAITGWGSAADRGRALEAGFDQHVLKPLDAKIVQRVLARVQGAGGAGEHG